MSVFECERVHGVGPGEILSRLISSRYSVRGFKENLVERATVERLVHQASQAPSWCNTQPWQVYYIAGDTLEKLRVSLLQAARDRDSDPDIPFTREYPQPYFARKKEADSELMRARNIANTDYRGIVEGIYANWRFFGAPQALVLTVPHALLPYALLDLGCFLQNLLLGMVAEGLGACPQASIAEYPQAIRRHVDIPTGQAIACGVSFGVPDNAVPANRCRTQRIPVSSVITYRDE